MVVTDQINALRALGTDPIRKLVVPHVLSDLFMTPILTIIADFVGMVGGWLVARFQLRVSTGRTNVSSKILATCADEPSNRCRQCSSVFA